MKRHPFVHRVCGTTLIALLIVAGTCVAFASEAERLYGIMSDGVSTTYTFAEVSTVNGQATPIFTFTVPYYLSALAYDENTGKFVAVGQSGVNVPYIGMIVEIDAVTQTIEEHVISGLPISPFTNFVGMEFDPTRYDGAQTACDHVLFTYGQDINHNLQNRIAAVNSSTGAVFDYTEPPLAVTDADIVVFNPATSQLIDADTNNPPFEAISDVFGAAPGIAIYANPYNDGELYDAACSLDGTMYFSRRATLDLWKLNPAGTGYLRIGPHLSTSPGDWAIGLAVGPALDKLVPVCGNGTEDAGEQCDDGNTDDGDGCSSCCTTEPCTGACDDGLFCNGTETCDPGGGCMPGTPPDCDDDVACTVDTCNEVNDACDHTPDDVACDDGDCCTIDDCEPVKGCVHTANEAAPVFTTQPSLGTCAVLWPPQHGYVDFSVADTGAAATGVCPIASVQFASCSSSQGENAIGTGDGNSTRDCVFTGSVMSLRAERNGACSPIGRVYGMTVAAIDICGQATISNGFEVGVWHDRGHTPPSDNRYSANPGSNQTDYRNGVNGTYPSAPDTCGVGSACVNGTNHDHSDADAEAEISQGAAISVDHLRLERASGGNVRLMWTEPAHQAGIIVTRFHIYRLDPVAMLWTQIAAVTKQTTSYLDAVLDSAAAYQYKISAVIK